MTESVTCPVCGNQIDAAVLQDEGALRRAIEILQRQLREIESQHPTPEHPEQLYGGYGGEPPSETEQG